MSLFSPLPYLNYIKIAYFCIVEINVTKTRSKL